MKTYFIFFRNYKKELILAPLLIIIDVLCEIVQPELMSKIVDQGVANKDMAYMLKVGGVMFALSLVAIIANVGNVYFSSKASVGFASELRKGLFDKIQKFAFSTINKFTPASLTTRMTNDVNIIQEVIMMSLRLLIRAPLMLVFAVIISVRINAGLASIIAIAIPLLSVCIYFLIKKGLPFFIYMQQKLDKLNDTVLENLVNIRVVKSFVREPFERQKFAVANTDLRQMAIKASGTIVLIMPVMQLVMNASIVAIVWFGGNKIISGTFQIGQLMSFITYITQILMSLMMLSMTIMTFSRAGASSKRLLEVLGTQDGMHDSEQALQSNHLIKQGKVIFQNVSFKYDENSKEYVLKNASFTVQPGEKIAVIGSTGSAKSTLLQLIPRLYDASEGHVLLDDLDIKDYTMHNLHMAIGMVPQNSELFSGTIKENLRWGNPSASDEEIIQAAKDAQAHDFIISFPKQYDTVLGQSGVNVSGGQKQRLCIARALLKNPVILLLDDSTSAVDATIESRIREIFTTRLKATTVFIIAQRISAIQSANKIIILDEGKIIAMDTHENLIKNNLIYQEIFHSQQTEMHHG